MVVVGTPYLLLYLFVDMSNSVRPGRGIYSKQRLSGRNITGQHRSSGKYIYVSAVRQKTLK